MSILQFKVQADYAEVIRLREEISRLETTLKSFGPGTTEATLNALKQQLSECRAEFRRLADEAARSGAYLERNINNQLANIRKNSTVNVKIQADNQQFHQAMEQQGKDFQEAMRNLEMYGSKVTSVFANLSRFAGFTAPLVGLLGFFNQVKETRSYFQDIESTMTTLLGTEEKSAEFCEKLEKAAYYNMFEYADLVGASKQMIAYGVATDQIIPKIDQLSEVATATKANLGEMVGMYTRAKAIGYVDSRALQTWASHGLVVKDVMKEMGIQAKGNKVTFEQLNQVLDHVTSEGGMFHGVMDSQMQNISAEIGQLEDNTSLMFNDIGKSIQEPLREVIKFAGVLVEHWRQVAIAIGGAVAAYAVIRTSRAADAAQFNRELEETKLKLEEINRTQEKKTYDKDISKAMKNGILSQEDGDKLQDARNELQKKGGNDKDLQQIIAEKEAEIQLRREAKAAIDEEREALEGLIKTQSGENGEQPRTLDNDIKGMVETGAMSDDEAQAMQQKRDAIDDLIQKRKEEKDAADANYEAAKGMVEQLTEEKNGIDELVGIKQDALDIARESGDATAIEAAQSELNAAMTEQERVAEELEMASQMQETASTQANTAADRLNNVEGTKKTMVSKTSAASKNLETAATKTSTVATNAETVAKKKGVIATQAGIVMDKAATAAKYVLSTAIGAVKNAMHALKAAFASNPIGLIITALTTVIGLFMSFNDEEEEATAEVERFGEAAIKTKNNVDTLYTVLETVSKESKVYKDALVELEKIAKDHGFVIDETQDKYTQLLALRYQMIEAIYQEGEAIQAANKIAEHQNQIAEDRKKMLYENDEKKGGIYKKIIKSNDDINTGVASKGAEIIGDSVERNHESLVKLKDQMDEIEQEISSYADWQNPAKRAELMDSDPELMDRLSKLMDRRNELRKKFEELAYEDFAKFAASTGIQTKSKKEYDYENYYYEFDEFVNKYLESRDDNDKALEKLNDIQRKNNWEEPEKPFDYSTATPEEIAAKANAEYQNLKEIGKAVDGVTDDISKSIDEVAEKDMTPKVDAKKLKEAMTDMYLDYEKQSAINRIVLDPDFDPTSLNAMLEKLGLTEEQIQKINGVVLAPGIDMTQLDNLGVELGISLDKMSQIKDYIMNPDVDLDPFNTLLSKLDLSEEELEYINIFVAHPDFDPKYLHAFLVKLGVADDKIEEIDKAVMEPGFEFAPLKKYLSQLDLTIEQINEINNMVINPKISDSIFEGLDRLWHKLTDNIKLMWKLSGWKDTFDSLGGFLTGLSTGKWKGEIDVNSGEPKGRDTETALKEAIVALGDNPTTIELNEFASKWNDVADRLGFQDPLKNKIREAIADIKKKFPEWSEDKGKKNSSNETKKRKDKELKKQNIENQRLEQERQYLIQQSQRIAKANVDALQDGIDKVIGKLNNDAAKQLNDLDNTLLKAVETIKDREKELWLLEDENRHALDWKQTKSDEEYIKEAKKLINYETQQIIIERELAAEKLKAHKEDIAMLRDYLKEYGSFEQRKLALTKEYEEKIKNAKNTAEKLIAKQEYESGNNQIEFEAISQNIDWYSVFSNAGIILESQLDETFDSLTKFINSKHFQELSASDQKTITESYNQMMSQRKESPSWDDLGNAIVEYRNAILQAKEDREYDSKLVNGDEAKKIENDLNVAEAKFRDVAGLNYDKFQELFNEKKEIEYRINSLNLERSKLERSYNEIMGKDASDRSDVDKKIIETYENILSDIEKAKVGKGALDESVEMHLMDFNDENVISAYKEFENASKSAEEFAVRLTQSADNVKQSEQRVISAGTNVSRIAQGVQNSFDAVSDFLENTGFTQLKELWDAFARLADLFEKRKALAKANKELANDVEKVDDSTTKLKKATDDVTDGMSNVASATTEAAYAIVEAAKTIDEVVEEIKEPTDDDENPETERRTSRRIRKDKDTSNMPVPEDGENSKEKKGIDGKIDKIVTAVDSIAGDIFETFMQILDILKDGIGTFISSMTDTFFNAIIGVLDNLLNFKDGMFRQIGESIYKGIMGIFKSFATLGGLLDWIHGGESDATLEEDIERLTAVNESLCDAISKLSDDLKESPIADAADVYKTQQENLNQSMKNTQEMMYRAGASHSSGFFGIGSERSSNHKIDREMTSGEWSRASKAAGVNINSAWQFFHLTSEQMAKIAKEAPDIYGKIKDLASKGHKDASQFMDDFIAYAEELEELKKSYWEVITDTNFDSVASQFKSTLLDMESSAEDFTNSFEEMMRQAVINSMMANTYNDMISEWYENFAKAMENDGLSDDEQRKLKKEYDEIVAQAIDERDNVIKAMGWEDSITQQATSRGVQGMSQDTGNAIEGRLTAIQIATEAIRANHNMQSTSLADIDDNMLLLMQSDANRSVMYENLERHVAKIYLEVMGINENTAAMVKPVLTMQLDLEQIKRNTNKL